MADRTHLSQSPRCRLSFSECALQGGSSTPISRQGAPPRRSANGCTKPMEPPAPIMAVSLPKPALSARRAASKAGPSGSVVHQGVVPLSLAVTLTPCGGLAVSFLMRSQAALRPSMLGTVRSERRARAESTIWFDEPWISWDSIAITVSDGRVHILSYTE